MSHLDSERLSLLAIGEQATDDEKAHLQNCDACSLELAELDYTVAVGRSTAALGELETPPERVWDRIRNELDATPRSKASRNRFAIGFALAASIVIVLVAVGTWTLLRPAAEPVQLATATLEAFPSHPGAVGEAIVLETADGTRELTVTLDASESENGFREVWLITADASALVSLGVLEGNETTLPVPEGLDLHEYVLVDVSQEPDDGNPDHSGDSIVRGDLHFA